MQNRSDSRFNKDDDGKPTDSRHVILLVDDDLMILELCRELLESEGYGVIVATNGLEAVEIYRERWKEISLVVLDVAMPKMDGNQAYLRLKEINPGIRSLLATGYLPDEMKTLLCTGDGLRVLRKPFRPPEFIGMVREVLRLS